ncbi:MAG TPA: sulfurtransferase-like selenium metabolism protein YedF [Anaerolineae bacterium]|nr:sulfurtransferase-like selenium metabolism protein YedF [Anaerolineae bacterium]
MATTVDARGLACPQPVTQTRRAMQQADHVVTLVDNDGAASNVRHMAESAGWRANVTRQGSDLAVELTRPGPGQEARLAGQESAQVPAGPLVLAVSGEKMGRGSAELGQILVRSFFHTLTEVQPRPNRVILFNAGVRLACAGSPVLDDLHALEAEGVEILACGTCLGYLDLKEKLAVGRISNMYEIAESLLNAGRVIHL